MKKKNLLLRVAILSGLAVCCFSCDKENGSPAPQKPGGSYILVTNNGQVSPNPSTSNMRITYLTDLDNPLIDCGEFPTIEHANTSGFRYVYKDKWLFVRSNKRGDRGIQKYIIGEDGRLQDAGFIPAPFPLHLLPVKFCIADDNKGYYVTQLDPFIVHMFNPSTMLKMEGNIDLRQEVNNFKPRIESEFEGKFGEEKPVSLIGQETVVCSNGKLFVNVHYGHTKGKGVFDALYNEFYLAVIDMKTNRFEKIITLPGIYNQGLPPLENQFYATDAGGSVYMISLQWNNYDPAEGIVLKSMDEAQLFKLGSNGEFEPDWRIKPSDLDGVTTSGVERRVFESVFMFGDDLYVSVSRSGVRPYGLVNIKNADFEIYRIDPQTKSHTKIEVPVTTPNASSGSFYQIGDELFIRVVNPDAKANGFYKLNKDKKTTTKVFDVSESSGIAFSLLKLRK